MFPPNKSELNEFCNSLSDEKSYFNVTFQRMMNSIWIIPEYQDGKLIAAAGVEKKYGIVRSWAIVKKEHWKKGVGAKLIAKRFEKCRKEKTCHVLLGIIDEKNIPSIKALTKQGYILVGKKGNLLYYLQAISPLGRGMIPVIKILFFSLLIIDKFRK
ncbi:MAG: GNAT family N-acetyltransferase [Desulfobacterales bacterium]|nr:GNAT family N-acetyltransferase [Desulfobacterales bacterium]